MVRGQADYGMYAAKAVGATLADMGDLAVRLGSIVEYDRRGDIVYLDDFGAPVLRWEVSSSLAGEYARLDSESVKSGSQAVRLHTENVAGNSITISKGIPVLGSKSIGYEISFSKLDTNLYLDLDTYYFTGTERFIVGVRIDTLLRTLSVYDSTLTYVKIADLEHLYVRDFLYFTFKLVIDFDTRKYKRLLFNIYQYDISAIAISVVANTTAPRIYTQITLSNANSDGGDVWLDNFIITQNEP